MKKWVVLIIASLFTNILSQTNVSPQFSELKGMEDQLGNTILFYRIFQDSSWNEIYFFRTNHIYKFNVETGADNFFLYDYNFETEGGMEHFNINDIDFWDSDPDKFIYGGHAGIFDPHTFVLRFDEPTINFFPGWIGSVNRIELSNYNDSIITLGCWANFAGVYIRTSRSSDGGYTWYTISDSLEFLTVKPDNDQVLFCFNDNGYISHYNGGLYKSTNGGVNFYLVDTLKKSPSAENDEILFDANANNIFRLFETMYGDFVLRISLDNGEAFSWETKYSSDNEIFINNDESISGTVYLADKKNILVSLDYGNNFSLYKTLERKIVGIYKKPNSNKLYAATKYKIYQITPDTIQVIKSLPIPDEVLDYYPLAVGNKWVFDEVTVVQDPYPNVYSRILVKEVLGDTLAPNGKRYYKVNDKTLWGASVLERVDSTEGKVYRYYEDSSLPENEYLAYDLLAEIGDTVSSFRIGFNTVMFTTMYEEGMFGKWGINKPKKVFLEYTLHPPIFSLTQNVGLDSIYSYFDFGNTWTTLKGCIIDGIVYGDTTTVSVENEQPPIATTFKLEQNYPNPFNPGTVIGYQLPVGGNVTLKVYDILGNEVATLVDEYKSAGEYEVEFSVAQVSRPEISSGVYFYQLRISGPEINSPQGQAGQAIIQTKKMILLK